MAYNYPTSGMQNCAEVVKLAAIEIAFSNECFSKKNYLPPWLVNYRPNVA